jgi:chromosome transmission fidelity protein 4
MASLIASRPRPRPAHTQGTTRCAYTPDGTKLVTVGSNNTIRLYKTGFDGEPDNIDDCQEQNLAVAASNAFFVAGAEDGTVSYYSLANNMFDKFLLRTSLPVRDVALSPDGKWCAVASDELTVKLVGIEDNTQLLTLKEHAKPTKHLAFDPKGGMLALSCTDGVIYVYSLTAEHPELIRKVDGVIGRIETESEASCKVAWHPDGRAFAVPTPTRDIQVVSKNDWEKQRVFSKGHDGDITAVAWSPNGALLATASKDKKLLIWSTKDQTVVARYEYPDVIDIAWHPTKNLASFTTSDGEVFICDEFVPEQFVSLLRLPKQPAPFIHDPLAEIAANGRRPEPNGANLPSRPRRGSLDSLDDLLDDDNFGEEDDGFVVDDDGAGYTLNAGRKRAADDGDLFGQRPSKRGNFVQPQLHPSFQPGSTPWRGNRKYLCLNLIGFVWTVDQDSHNTVTVEFYDHEFHRDFHFTDTFLYDKACLNDKGALFSCPPKDDAPAVILYRPHETWTQRSDWRIQLPKGEAVLAMSLSDTFITVTTTGNYVRIYTLFGIPYRVYRPKSTPIVSCASWRDYVLTMGNGPVGADGMCRLLYTIENIKRDEICQNEDTVALPEGATVKSVFFSDNGVSSPPPFLAHHTNTPRTPASTTQPAPFSPSSTGVSPPALPGSRSSTPNSSRASPQAAKTKATSPSPSPTTNSTASSSKEATSIPTSRARSSPNSTFPSPSPHHPPKNRNPRNPPTTGGATQTTMRRCSPRHPTPTQKQTQTQTQTPPQNPKPSPSPNPTSSSPCTRPSSRTYSQPRGRPPRSARCSRASSWTLTRRCCRCWPWSAARAARRGGCARSRW